MATDVNISVYNNTQEFQNIVIFQQQDELNQMFDKLFPIAWKVFPLNPPEPGQERKGSTIYPIQQRIGVTRNPQSSDKLPYGTLDITQLAENGQRFKYFLNEHNAQIITKLDGDNIDTSISCLNSTPELVSIAFAKNSATLVVQKDVSNGDQAMFKLTPKLYFMYLNNIKEGDVFKSQITGEHVQEVELTGKTQINAFLKIDPDVGGNKKIWDITAK
ncbi:MAG: hypothetical protein WBB43_18100 [Limnoraphis sp.]